MRKSGDIRREYDAASAEHEAVARKLRTLREELVLALVREATENADPWVGKRVRKSVVRGFRGKRSIRKGTVTIYDPSKHRGLRGIYMMKPGDLFVLNDSGITGYKWLDYGEQEPSWAEQ